MNAFGGTRSEIERDEELAQRDMKERARRLSAFQEATQGRVWWQAPNGRWYLVAKSSAALLPPSRRRDVDRLIATLTG